MYWVSTRMSKPASTRSARPVDEDGGGTGRRWRDARVAETLLGGAHHRPTRWRASHTAPPRHTAKRRHFAAARECVPRRGPPAHSRGFAALLKSASRGGPIWFAPVTRVEGLLSFWGG